MNRKSVFRFPQSIRWVVTSVAGFGALLLAVAICAGVDPDTGDFSYGGYTGVDDSLGRVALYLMDQNQVEGNAFVSEEVEEGIVGFQLRYSDDGNKLVDARDWFSVRRYTIPAVPDTIKEKTDPGYWKKDFIELVDTGLDGLNNLDYYFINGERFDLNAEPTDVLRQYQVQIESGVSTYIRNLGYDTITGQTGSTGQTGIRKEVAFEDGSLPANLVLGLDLGYVFKPIVRGSVPLDEASMAREIKKNLGLVYSATLTYTDVQDYRLRDLSTETQLIQRSFDPIEETLLRLVIDALFDRDGNGIVTADDLLSGYTRFRELHQELAEDSRAAGRRIILPNEKLSRLRQEYESVHGKAFEF